LLAQFPPVHTLRGHSTDYKHNHRTYDSYIISYHLTSHAPRGTQPWRYGEAIVLVVVRFPLDKVHQASTSSITKSKIHVIMGQYSTVVHRKPDKSVIQNSKKIINAIIQQVEMDDSNTGTIFTIYKMWHYTHSMYDEHGHFKSHDIVRILCDQDNSQGKMKQNLDFNNLMSFSSQKHKCNANYTTKDRCKNCGFYAIYHHDGFYLNTHVRAFFTSGDYFQYLIVIPVLHLSQL
jgi:hypothetical protein